MGRGIDPTQNGPGGSVSTFGPAQRERAVATIAFTVSRALSP